MLSMMQESECVAFHTATTVKIFNDVLGGKSASVSE